MTLSEARERIGSGVVYQPYGVTKTDIYGRPLPRSLWKPAAQAEDGEITSVNDSYVFVRFVGDRQSKACRAHDLEFAQCD